MSYVKPFIYSWTHFKTGFDFDMSFAVTRGLETFATDRAAVGLELQMRAKMTFEIAELVNSLLANFTLEYISSAIALPFS